MPARRFFSRPADLARLIVATALLGGTTSVASGQDDDRAARWAALDATYAVGPTTARDLGLRIAWQATLDDPVIDTTRLGDQVFTVDEDDRLSRIDGKSGLLIWTNSVVDRHHAVWGVTEGFRNGELPWGRNEGDTVCVVCDSFATHVDYNTGAVVKRDRLGKVPSSKVVRHGRHLIYGTHIGQVVWFDLLVGFEWRATQLWGPVVTTPIVEGDFVSAVSSKGNEIRKKTARVGDTTMMWGPDDDPSTDQTGADRFWRDVNPERGSYDPLSRMSSIGMRGGSIGVLNVRTAGVLWGFGDELYEGVVANPAFGDGMLFCPGLDQNLWAFDAGNGSRAWKYLSSVPLTTSPHFVSVETGDDRRLSLVLQWIEGTGLVAFEANPGDTIEGIVVWTTPDAAGEPLGDLGGRLLLWDSAERVLRMLDPTDGSITRSTKVPAVSDMQLIDGSIYATADDGRIIRLDPRG